ncbi:MAG: hypothetical protein ACR2L6_12165, partial [Gemmatimonadaceae bacterium]
PQEAVRDYTERLADERARRDFSPRRLYQIATEASDFLGALPHRLDVITKRIAANDVGLRLDTPQLGTLLEGRVLDRRGAGRLYGAGHSGQRSKARRLAPRIRLVCRDVWEG